MIKFNLKNLKESNTLILMKYYTGEFRPLVYSTGEKIKPEYFDKINYRAIVKGLPAEIKEKNTTINRVIQRHQDLLEDIIGRMKRAGEIPTVARLREELDKELLHKPRTDNSKNFLKIFDEYVALAKEGKRLTRNGDKITVGRLSVYSGFRTLIEGYKSDLKLTDINQDFYDDLVYHMNTKKLMKSTQGRHINVLKAFIHWCNKRGISSIKTDDFLGIDEKADTVYLTKEELKRVIELKQKGERENCRQFFIISCLVGQRIGDVLNINESSFYDNYEYLKIKQQKTGVEVNIPTNDLMLSIFKEHGYKAPPIPIEQSYNKMIKDVCRDAKIEDAIEWDRAKGFERDKKIKFKWELVSSHTARRTCATLMYLEGKNLKQIMGITGHASVETLMRYLRVTNIENAQILKKEGGLFRI